MASESSRSRAAASGDLPVGQSAVDAGPSIAALACVFGERAICCHTIRHDTGVSSTRRTSSVGSMTAGSDHCDSNASRAESGMNVICAKAPSSDSAPAVPTTAGAPAA